MLYGEGGFFLEKGYNYTTNVRDNEILRNSFNQLTRKVFGFDFEKWYDAGHWGEWYLPHAMVDGEVVVSNVSVNLMKFDVCGVQKNYLQLGTVMTDKEYRGRGLNRDIMERILEEYQDKVDGIYLFGGDSVLDYYPKFGFTSSKEYEYYMQCNDEEHVLPYILEKVNINQAGQCEQIYSIITRDSQNAECLNQNDGFYMSENLGLYQFWMLNGYGKKIYYLPECDAYIIADVKEQILNIYQILGKNRVDLKRLAKTFGENVKEIVLGYTPAYKEQFSIREYKKRDCTLFILDNELQCVENNKMRFPILSHA